MSEREQRDAIQPAAFQPLDAAAAVRGGRRHPLRWVLATSVLAFAAVMAFLFSARSLEVVVQAESPAEIAIAGFALPIGGRFLLLPGDYAVRVEADGYTPLDTRVTVTDAASQRVSLELSPLPGRVSVTTEPAGARFSVDGEHLGETPLRDLPLAAGTRELLLQAPRYRPLQLSYEVTGREVEQRLSLSLQPAWADVSLDSDPQGAEVLLDGEPAGTTPAVLEILEGEHQLTLQAPAYAAWHRELAVVAGSAQDLGSITLQPAAGLLHLDSVPAGANVTLDGEFQGRTPLDLEVAPGREHSLAVSHPGYRRHSENLGMDAATQASRTVRLQAELGEVAFDISPPRAVLRIDGREVGKGSRVLSLPAAEHRVEVSLAGYISVQQRVTPRPGLQQRVKIALLTEGEARAARLKPEVTTALGQTLLLFRPADSATADFTMGASRREPGRRSNEVLHPVSLRRPFYLQTTEVTNAQFRKYQSDHNSGQLEGNSLNRDQQPVVQVSWQQAASFCNWLSRREGLPPFYTESRGIITGFNPAATGYRLPSEAEWAWAARSAGDKLLRFPWGDQFPPPRAVENYADNSSAYVTGRFLSNYEDGFVVSAPVASFAPNALGLYDMGGNVAEWVNDVYAVPASSGDPETDPLGGQSGDNYTIRGAGWAHSRIGELRLSYRDYGQAGRDDVGFRLARYAE